MALLPWRAVAGCPNLCSSHGFCDDASGVCHCDFTYTGGDCSLRTCPDDFAWSDMASADDTAHARAECSNAGLCNRERGNCMCFIGFEGPACERMSCPGGADMPCNSHGVCMSMRNFAGTIVGENMPYTQPWDADKVYGCLCDTGYTGHDCMSKPCPVGDDPLTTGQVDGTQIVHCNASHGTFRLSFLGDTTIDIAADASRETVEDAINTLESMSGMVGGTGGGSTVTFTGRGQSTACGVDGVVTEVVDTSQIAVGTSYNVTYYRSHNFTVTFSQLYGPQELIEVQDKNALSDGSVISVSFGVNGTKESDVCSNRGICDAVTGICTCMKNYDTSNGRGFAGDSAHNRGDCGFPTASITACPGEVKCSAHGVCEEADTVVDGVVRPPSFRCDCSAGWFGADCSVRTCPLGAAWFGYPFLPEAAHAPAECSNRGLCDTSKGECTCDPGFTGAACERKTCPSQIDIECNGRGTCLTMTLLAEKHKDNRGSARPFTYGATPNNPLTWDASAMTGCYCDGGWHGYDCSLKSCPTGADPLKGGNVEKQAFACTTVPMPSLVASGAATTYGSFTISFRGVETAWIDINASEATVKAEIEKLSTIGTVQVEFSKIRVPVEAAAAAAAVAAAAAATKALATAEAEAAAAVAAEAAAIAADDPDAESVAADAIVTTEDAVIAAKALIVTTAAAVKTTAAAVAAAKLAANVACTSDGSNNVEVTFLTDLGDLPPLTFRRKDSVQLGSIRLFEGRSGGVTNEGTQQLVACSNRGLCNEITGQCTCFEGFASSNGRGGPGSRGDCGHMLEFVVDGGF